MIGDELILTLLYRYKSVFSSIIRFQYFKHIFDVELRILKF